MGPTPNTDSGWHQMCPKWITIFQQTWFDTSLSSTCRTISLQTFELWHKCLSRDFSTCSPNSTSRPTGSKKYRWWYSCLRNHQSRTRRKPGFKLNWAKWRFLQTELEFFGQIFSKDGTCPDPNRVDDLLIAPQPTNVAAVRGLLGMANYSSKYIPDFATLTAPLCELTRKNTQFRWTKSTKIVLTSWKKLLLEHHVWHTSTCIKRHSYM